MLLEISRSSPSRGGPMNLKTGGPFELKIQPSGGPFLVETGTPAECLTMRVDVPLPSHCAVWGPFSRPIVSSAELAFPEQWEILWSLTMAPSYVGTTCCGQQGS
jgi:hypothetical protein